MSSADADIGIGNAFVEMKTLEKLQEINEHIKKEQNSLKFQYRIEQRA